MTVLRGSFVVVELEFGCFDSLGCQTKLIRDAEVKSGDLGFGCVYGIVIRITVTAKFVL